VREEDIARVQQRGMWAGAFIAPWDWRHRDRNTVILGALSVPQFGKSALSSTVQLDHFSIRDRGVAFSAKKERSASRVISTFGPTKEAVELLDREGEQ
jgi:hypothetical protein